MEDQGLMNESEKIIELVERIETEIFKISNNDQSKIYREKVNMVKTKIKVKDIIYTPKVLSGIF